MFPLVGARRPNISVNLIKDNRLKYAKDLNAKTGIWYTYKILPQQSQERERDVLIFFLMIMQPQTTVIGSTTPARRNVTGTT